MRKLLLLFVTLLALILLPLVACSSNPDPVWEDLKRRSPALVANSNPCKGPVTVYIVNHSSYRVRVTFDGRPARKIVKSFGADSVVVGRARLRRPIKVEIAMGGMSRGPAMVDATPVQCDVATLYIYSRIYQSVFFGADVRHGRERG